MAYPGGIPTFSGFTSSHTLAVDNHAAQHNLEQSEIVALATKLGTGASVPASGVVLRGTGGGASGWGQVALANEVTGVLPIASGGTGQSTLANLTLVTPTLTTPVINDFTSAVHSHANNSGGGQINGSNALLPNTIQYISLLSTIFSGKIVNGSNAGTAGGTANYVNLGGILICFGEAGAISLTAAVQNTATVVFPVTFTSPPIVLANSVQESGTVALQGRAAALPTTTGVALECSSTTGTNQTGSVIIDWIAIGV